MRGPSLATFLSGLPSISIMQTPVMRVIALTSMAMIAFAANSLLCRIALTQTTIDAATFTTIRLMSGALVLWLVVRIRRGTSPGAGNWGAAFALFIYAAGLSFAYMRLPAATGALLLFGAVQATMIGYGIYTGERLAKFQIAGLMLAIGGLVGLLLPGLSAPPLYGSMLMLSAGVAWGIYSLIGKGKGDPTCVTAGNFLRAVPIAVTLSLVTLQEASLDLAGFSCAALSGALASGVGYVVWYTAIPALKAANAATVQLSVPVITALGGVFLLGESISLRMIMASLAILGGIALVIVEKRDSYRAQKVIPESDSQSLQTHSALVAYDEQTGFQLAQESAPDIIFHDIGMPIIDGYAAARRLRSDARFKSTILVAVTDYDSTSDRKECNLSGLRSSLD